MRLIDAVTAADMINNTHNIPLAELVDTFAGIPELDAAPVVHGYWTPANYKPTRYDKCSICGKRKTIEEEFVYCPWCGAKMDGERKEGKA